MWPGAILQHFFQSAPVDQHDLFASPGTWAHAQRMETGSERDLFDGGPPTRLQALLGLMTPEEPNYVFRVIVGIGVGWLPLLLLTIAQSIFLHDRSFVTFASDFGVQARSLLVVPLLILAEAKCLPRLSAVAWHFRDAGLIAPYDLPVFRHIAQSTMRLRDSMRLEIAVLVIAATVIMTLAIAVPLDFYPTWHRVISGSVVHISPAGWWHRLVSVPILMILLVGWLWRLAVWTRFLYLVSRLPLRLVPSHPDCVGGLKFVGLSVQAFSYVAFPFAAILAGAMANRVVHDGVQILSFRYVVLGFVVVVAALFVGPMFVFLGKMMSVSRKGVFEYGSLARDVGLQLEQKWLGRRASETALSAPDFSATTDLYSIAANVYGMKLLPVSLENLIFLIIATASPFIPVVFLAVPPGVLFHKLAGILL